MRLFLGALFVVSGCEGCRTAPATTDPMPTASITAVPSALVIPDAAPSKCTVGEITTVDTDIEKEGSITSAVLPDGRFAVGFAKANLTPVVAVAGADGKMMVAPVPWAVVKDQEKQPSGARRYVLRVTPLIAIGTSVKAGVDIIDMEGTDKRTYRCGPGDAPAMVSTSKESEVVDCRTFFDGTRPVIASTKLQKTQVTWSLAAEPAPSDVKIFTAPLGTAKYDDKLGFQSSLAIAIKDSGTVFAARQDGGLVLARRDMQLGKLGEPARFPYDSPITAPSFATKDKKVTVVFGMSSRSEVYGATFAMDDKPIAKPGKLAVDLGTDETVSFSVAHRPNGDIVIGFITNHREGAAGKIKTTRAEIAIFDANLTIKSAAFDLAVPDPREMRIGTLPDGRILATYIDQGGGTFTIKSVVVTCN